MKKNQPYVKAFIISSLLTLLLGCKITPPVTTDYDTRYDYSKLKTYAWILPTAPKKVQTLDTRRQNSAIETLLNRKGFNKAGDPTAADFLIRTHTITDKKTSVSSYYGSWGHYPYYYSYHGYGYNNNAYVREYEVGTLILDIVDPKKEEVIWRGSVSRKLAIYSSRTPEERASIAMKNAELILGAFPPGRKILSEKP